MFPTFGRYLRDAVKYIHQHRSAALQATILSAVLLLIVSYFTVPPTELNPYVFFRKRVVRDALLSDLEPTVKKMEAAGVNKFSFKSQTYCTKGYNINWKSKTSYLWDCQVVITGVSENNSELVMADITKYVSISAYKYDVYVIDSQKRSDEIAAFNQHNPTLLLDADRIKKGNILLSTSRTYAKRPDPFYIIP